MNALGTRFTGCFAWRAHNATSSTKASSPNRCGSSVPTMSLNSSSTLQSWQPQTAQHTLATARTMQAVKDARTYLELIHGWRSGSNRHCERGGDVFAAVGIEDERHSFRLCRWFGEMWHGRCQICQLDAHTHISSDPSWCVRGAARCLQAITFISIARVPGIWTTLYAHRVCIYIQWTDRSSHHGTFFIRCLYGVCVCVCFHM